jgi:ATP-dependent helicase/DNAse subunit B
LLALLPAIEVPAAAASASAVLIAEPLAIRARRFRRVFVTGMCEGEFPASGAPDPFLGDDRRRELALASGVVLPGADDDAARERYLLYACVSRATEQVTFSYRSAEEDGSVVRHSPFLDDVATLFVDDWWARRTRRLLADVVWPAEQAPTARDHALAVAAAAPAPPITTSAETRTLGAAALAHVRHRELVSGSALELFELCPVRWLVERQLAPEDLEPEGQALAKGTFLHAVLERVLRALGAPLTSATLPAAEQALAAEMRVLPPEMAPGLSPAVRGAILRGIEADLKRFLRYEAQDVTEWTPREFELAFETVLGAGEETVGFRGTIDRIDIAADGRRVVLRDYKSGSGGVERSAAKWIEGGTLQIGLYMIAVRRLLELEPVAGLYQPLTGGDLRPRGAYLSGTELGSHTYTNDGLDQAELDALLDEVERAALELVATIRRGELTPCPATCSREGCAHPGICWA